jgi:hypothetical protein
LQVLFSSAEVLRAPFVGSGAKFQQVQDVEKNTKRFPQDMVAIFNFRSCLHQNLCGKVCCWYKVEHGEGLARSVSAICTSNHEAVLLHY